MNNKKSNKFIYSIFLFFIFIFFNLNCFTTFANSSKEINTPEISARSAILVDNKTNKILYSKNENEKMYPASTTKIMTAILVLENGNLNDIITASPTAISSIPNGYTTAEIKVNEQFTIEQLLKMLLVLSANDAANVLAEYTGGSIESFVSIMNTKAHDLGLTNTHFTNTYGMHDDNHYTTASDLVKLMQYCIKNPNFRSLSGLASCAIPSTNLSEPRLYTTTNELFLTESNYYTSFVTIGKTGYTAQAGQCLVSMGYKNDIELINIVLNSSNRFADSISLYDYGYSNYSIKTIINQNDVVTNLEISNAQPNNKKLNLLSYETISALAKNSDDITLIQPEITLTDNIEAPIFEGDKLGKVSYTINGIKYTTDLIAEQNIEKFEFPIFLVFGILIIISIIVLAIILYNFFIKK